MTPRHQLVGLAASDSLQIDRQARQLVHRPRQYRVGSRRRQSDPEHPGPARRRLNDEMAQLQPGQAGRRTQPLAAWFHEVIARTEMHDDLEQSIRERPLAKAGHRAIEQPDVIDETGEMGWTREDVRPRTELVSDDAVLERFRGSVRDGSTGHGRTIAELGGFVRRSVRHRQEGACGPSEARSRRA